MAHTLALQGFVLLCISEGVTAAAAMLYLFEFHRARRVVIAPSSAYEPEVKVYTRASGAERWLAREAGRTAPHEQAVRRYMSGHVGLDVGRTSSV